MNLVPKKEQLDHTDYMLLKKTCQFYGVKLVSILLLLHSVMTNQTLNPWYSTKLVVFLRSSAVPQSLVFRAVGSKYSMKI
jgi:hypothetical protein